MSVIRVARIIYGRSDKSWALLILLVLMTPIVWVLLKLGYPKPTNGE
jgi:hypothetical protein